MFPSDLSHKSQVVASLPDSRVHVNVLWLWTLTTQVGMGTWTKQGEALTLRQVQNWENGNMRLMNPVAWQTKPFNPVA